MVMMIMATWNTKKKDDTEKMSYDERRAAIRAQRAERLKRDNEFLLCGILGHPKTGKSGSAMDCRTEQEIKDGWTVRVLDLDDGALATWDANWNRDEGIDIYVPNERHADKTMDWDSTFQNCLAWLDETEEEIAKGKVKAVVIDGMDKVYDGSGDVMREALVNMNQSRQGIIRDTINLKVQPFQWKVRNDIYKRIQDGFMGLNTHRFIITHLKPIYDGPNLSEGPSRWEADWHKNTPQRMLQTIWCEKVGVGNDAVYRATLRDCKTNSDAVGMSWDVFKTYGDKSKKNEWFGIDALKEGKF